MDEPLPRFADVDEIRKAEPAKALALYRRLWETTRQIHAAWGYAYCLRKQGELDRSIEVCNEALELDSDNQYIRTEIAWALYEKKIKPAKEDGDLHTILSAGNEIYKLTSDHWVRRKVALKVIQVAKLHNKWQTVLDWAGPFKPEDFDKEPYQRSDRRLMSDREIFYNAKARGLYEIGEFMQAREFAQQGLTEFSDDIFLARTAALALAEQGDIQTAAQELRRLSLRPNADWYFKADLAQLEMKLGHADVAYRLGSEAALRTREDKQRVRLLLLLANAALAQGELRTAAEHIALCKAVRIEKNWKIPPELVQLENRIKDSAKASDDDISAVPNQLRELQRICREHWQQATKVSVQRKVGRIGRVDPAKPFTFIYPDDRSAQVYARMKNVPKTLAFDGARVEFTIKPSFDPKKNAESVEAVDIRSSKS